jgi:Mor family transcriptional regulator
VTEAHPSRDDRIVAEFGDGYEVEGIAARYGLTVDQVFAVVEQEVGPVGQEGQFPPPPGYYAPPPGYYPAPGYYPPPAPAQYAPPPQPDYPPPPAHYAPPPGYYAPQAYQVQGFANPDMIVAEYGEGHDVELIARRHGITVEQVYLVVQQTVTDDRP